MEKSAKVYIAGHRGMVGSAIKRKLEKLGFANFITRTFEELICVISKIWEILCSRKTRLCGFGSNQSWWYNG